MHLYFNKTWKYNENTTKKDDRKGRLIIRNIFLMRGYLHKSHDIPENLV